MLSTVRWPRFRSGFLGGNLGSRRCVDPGWRQKPTRTWGTRPAAFWLNEVRFWFYSSAH
jgi:hypothetical protein